MGEIKIYDNGTIDTDNTSTMDNVLIGDNTTGRGLITGGGRRNIAIGDGSLSGATTGGTQNIAIGDNSLTGLTSGDSNIAIGQDALAM